MRRAAGVLLAAAAAAALLAAAIGTGGMASARGTTLATRDVATLPGGNAVYATTAPGVADRIYVAGLGGSVYSLDPSEAEPEPVPFLRVPRSRIAAGDEQGLLSIAFAPRFERSRLVYVYFVNRDGDIEVDEYRAPSDAAADPESRRRVITIRHRSGYNHNGGTAAFGPGGFLYLGTGDGGNVGDPPENAQNRQRLLGKLLRIDPRRAGRRPYSVPRSNPLVGRPGRDEVFALGLRNPYRFAFDGDVAWIGDVGQGSWEEVDRAGPARLRGANFGWDRWEGTHRYRQPGDPSAATPGPKGHTTPLFEYAHTDGRCSVTGGVVAPPGAPSAIAGRYVFADFCQGQLASAAARGEPDPRYEGVGLDLPTSFAIGPDGGVYVTEYGGTLVELVDGVG